MKVMRPWCSISRPARLEKSDETYRSDYKRQCPKASGNTRGEVLENIANTPLLRQALTDRRRRSASLDSPPSFLTRQLSFNLALKLARGGEKVFHKENS